MYECMKYYEILLTTWWGYTGGVKSVILSFWSYYSILFGITATFPILLHCCTVLSPTFTMLLNT